MRIIDGKYYCKDDWIYKRGTNEIIPELEPIILFRGRDKLALKMLQYYLELCELDGCTKYQLDSVQNQIERFRKFAETSPTMKQPGITEGR